MVDRTVKFKTPIKLFSNTNNDKYTSKTRETVYNLIKENPEIKNNFMQANFIKTEEEFNKSYIG